MGGDERWELKKEGILPNKKPINIWKALKNDTNDLDTHEIMENNLQLVWVSKKPSPPVTNPSSSRTTHQGMWSQAPGIGVPGIGEWLVIFYPTLLPPHNNLGTSIIYIRTYNKKVVTTSHNQRHNNYRLKYARKILEPNPFLLEILDLFRAGREGRGSGGSIRCVVSCELSSWSCRTYHTYDVFCLMYGMYVLCFVPRRRGRGGQRNKANGGRWNKWSVCGSPHIPYIRFRMFYVSGTLSFVLCVLYTYYICLQRSTTHYAHTAAHTETAT